jgi:hypothetical protein
VTHELRVTNDALKPGDHVRVRADALITNAPGLVGVVKAVSDGGTVTLKDAIHGYRCWPVEQLEKV